MLEETVGAAGTLRRPSFAAASTDSPGTPAGGSEVGVVELVRRSTFAPTSTSQTAAAVQTTIGEGRVGASDFRLRSTSAEAPTPWQEQTNPMAIRWWRAPCVADLMLTTMLTMATLDDPGGTEERVTRWGVRELDGS